jgi:uncharacterized cupredoxin-like copper-binding protein
VSTAGPPPAGGASPARLPQAGGASPAGVDPAGPTRPAKAPWRTLALVGGILLALGLAGIAAAWSGGPGGTGPGHAANQVEVSMRFSAFSTSKLRATAGVPVTVVLRNDDPIDHEWLVGDASFHDRHRTGTEAHHGARPTEVSVPAGSTVTTTVLFRVPGSYPFICHLPGHEAYGMVGVLVVSPAAR